MMERCWHRRCPSLAAASSLCQQPAPLAAGSTPPSARSAPSLHFSISAQERPPQTKPRGQQLRALAVAPAAEVQVSTSAPGAQYANSRNPSGGQDSRQPPLGADPRPVTAAYVHLPFCKRKCFYCDFPVVAVGAAGADSPAVADRFSDYLSLLLREIAATRRVGPRAELSTVFFGGGTPSLIPPAQLGDVLDALRRGFGIAEGAEISMEADPGTFDAQRLRQYMDLGVNRFSVGVQAFQQPLLEACGRSHSLAEARVALDAVRAAGPRSWSLDLISGLPGLTPYAWRESLSAAIAAEPPHISVYDLQVEDGTPFGRWYPPGHAALPDDEAGAAMYRDASHMLREAGYEHYEVSNYAAPGHRCRHNEVYWRNEPYYAFGLGSASYLHHRRFSRPRQMVAYRSWLAALEEQGDGQPGRDQAPQPPADQLLDAVMLSLRTADGLDLAAVAAQHGPDAADRIKAALQPHVESGLVSVVEQQLQLSTATHKGFQPQSGPEHCNAGRTQPWPCLRLADPGGFLMSNDIISDVFAALTPD